MTARLLPKISAALLPRPGQVKELINPSLKVLLLCDAENSLAKRVRNELSYRKVKVETETVTSSEAMVSASRLHEPDLIVCPFMTKRIPESIYSNPDRPCLIVHPGIAGDRGASSLDWAILDKKPSWGVTVLQAAEELDAGDIWSTSEFHVPENSTKTSLYVGEVSDHAVNCVLDAVSRFSQNIAPVPLDYSNNEVKGNLNRNMKRTDRKIDWSMTAEEIVRRTRMSDTQPGAIANVKFNDVEVNVRLFDAHEETGETSVALRTMMARSRPGTILGHKNGAILVKAGDSNAVWIGQMKQHIKVAAMTELKCLSKFTPPPELNFPNAFEEIRVEQCGPVCFVYFDFYNGAMDQYQAARLEQVLKTVARQDCKIVALMGGERFFSTGIHLCAIESSQNKAKEAMANINKINDVILALSELRDKVTVAVLRGNAGAGGEMMSMACDYVLSHPSVLVTPTYKSMCLHGSEYWTYFLPRRVGEAMALRLVESDTTLSAQTAQHLGLIDEIIGRERAGHKHNVLEYCHQILDSGKADQIIKDKLRTRTDDWFKTLQSHRDMELGHMRNNFQQENFLRAMKAFVYHKKEESNNGLSLKPSRLLHQYFKYKLQP